MKRGLPLTFCISLAVFIAGAILLLNFTGPHQKVFTPPVAKTLFWLTVISGILAYSTLAYLLIARVTREFSPLRTTMAAFLVAVVTAPVAFFAFWFAVFSYDSIPQQTSFKNGQKIYRVAEDFHRESPIYLVSTDSWLWLEQDPSVTECEVYPQSTFCADSPSDSTGGDSAASSPQAPAESGQEQDPAQASGPQPLASQNVEKIGENFGLYGPDGKAFVPAYREGATWFGVPEPQMSGELYSSFPLGDQAGVASLGTPSGAKNYITLDAGHTWKRFITPDMEPGQDVSLGEPGAFIEDARLEKERYWVKLNYPSWSNPAEEGRWYSSSDGTNWTKASQP